MFFPETFQVLLGGTFWIFWRRCCFPHRPSRLFVCLFSGLSWCECAGSTILRCVRPSWKSSAAWRMSSTRLSKRSVSITAPTTSPPRPRSSTRTSWSPQRTPPWTPRPPSRPLRRPAQRACRPPRWPPAPSHPRARRAPSWTSSPPASRRPMGSRGRAFRRRPPAQASHFGLLWTNCLPTLTWTEGAKTSVPCHSHSPQPADVPPIRLHPPPPQPEESTSPWQRLWCHSKSFFIRFHMDLL